MMSPFSSLLLALAACILHISGAGAQQCYYPNGAISTVDTPCPNSDLCCPANWHCLSNGLCYYPPDDHYERHTCTDKTWKSEECPNFCTYSAAGNEAILKCDSGQYCCDGNRQGGNCCDGQLQSVPDGTDYLDLRDSHDKGTVQPSGQPAANPPLTTSLPAAQAPAQPPAAGQPPKMTCACPPAT